MAEAPFGSSTPVWVEHSHGGTLTKTIKEGHFLDQFRALMYRNLAIKKRDRRKTMTELLMPLYWIIILAIIRVTTTDTVLGPVNTPHGNAPLMDSLIYLKDQILHVAPNTKEVVMIMEEVQNISRKQSTIVSVKYYNTEDDLVKVFSDNKTSVNVAIIFPPNPLGNMTYTLRFNPLFTLLPSSSLWTPEQQCRNEHNLLLEFSVTCQPNAYFFSGFSALQTVIDTALTKLTTETDVDIPYIVLENFPKQKAQSMGGMLLRNLVPLYMVFAWAQFIVYMMMLVVEEKEKKLRESMKVMGLRDSVYWLSWFSVYGMYVLLLALICIILLPLAQVFQNANVFLLFILFMLYGFSSIMFGFMLTPFFNKAKVAGVVGNLVLIMLSLLFYLQVYLQDEVNPGIFWGLALLSPCAFAFAIDKVILFDYAANGINFDSMWDGPGLPFAGSLIMISIDVLLYLFLAYYLDNVIPSEYGTKRRPWFIFQKSFWLTDNKLETSFAGGVNIDDLQTGPDIEPVSAEVQEKVAVCIRNLEKTFYPKGKNPVKAVDGFSLDMYEGQITAILGHNGAGKTTLFNILTGMISSTKGSATIFNMNVMNINELTKIHRITGICPQHDVVFQTLTPREHLSFFARIRGVSSKDIESEVNRTLKDVFLEDKANTKAVDLSGGQRRKLSIAIALIGDPKLIFLDEPTAGVDAYSRRKLWTLLKNRKQDKVILLTTHFMDEADILADRKAIMSKGRLRCCGSSLFLKNKFGLGYHLTLIVDENSEERRVASSLQRIIPDVQLVRHYGKEMSFILPCNSSPYFPSLFSQLDKSITSDTDYIQGYGVSMTTLEEVFLALHDESEGGELGSMDNMSQQMIREKSPSASPVHESLVLKEEGGTQSTNMSINKGFTIKAVDVQKDSWRIFGALFKIRILGLIREPVAVIFLIIFPLIFTVLSIFFASSQKIKYSTGEALLLDPKMYDHSLTGALIHNGTTHPLESLVSVLRAAGMQVDSYSGNYSDLIDEHLYIGALNINSFFTPERSAEKETQVRLRFNDSYMHSIPILVNLLNNGVKSSLNETEHIKVLSHSLPLVSQSIEFDVSSFFAPVMIGFALTITSATIAMDLVNDREIKARYMLRVNGVGFHLYFSSYLIIMMSIYMVSYIGLLIIIAAFNVKSLIIGPAFATVAILYLLYMPAAILFSATMSYMFDKSETARQFFPSMVTTLGFITYTMVSMVDSFVISNGTNPSQIIHVIFTIIFPPYIPFGLLYYINKVYLNCSILSSCSNLSASDYMTTEIVVIFVMTIIHTLMWYLLLRVADTVKLGGTWRSALWIKAKGRPLEEHAVTCEEEDEDIKQEREKVASAFQQSSLSSPILIYNLGKIYKKTGKLNECTKSKKKKNDNLTALKTVSFEVKQSQVFGLLGPNGAGKTTALKIMTAEESPSWGKVQMCGEDILSSISDVFEVMGYCPQHDALWNNITVAEHIACYAEIRGITGEQVNRLVDAYISGFEIEEHKNKRSRDCSGGTKRKLSYILSMLGRPKVVLLDEPSTGLDPKSKRFLWNSILSSFQDERCAILTTHSMEEADALCSSIGILVHGSLRCIGPIQHLKNKYGGGYSLELKVRQEVNQLQSHSDVPALEMQEYGRIGKVKAKVKETFPNAILDEQFDERLVYKVPQSDVTSLALIFELLEQMKRDWLVDEYALSQTTLDQVFIQFARQQEEGEEKTA